MSLFGARGVDTELRVIHKDNNSVKNILQRIEQYVKQNPTVSVVYVAGRSEIINLVQQSHFANSIPLSSIEIPKLPPAIKDGKPVVKVRKCQMLTFDLDKRYGWEYENEVEVDTIDKSALYFVYSKVETSEQHRSVGSLYGQRTRILAFLQSQGQKVVGFPKSYAHIPEKLGMTTLGSYLDLVITARKHALDADRKIYNSIQKLSSTFGYASYRGVGLNKVKSAPQDFLKAVALIDSTEMYLYDRLVPSDSKITGLDESFFNKYKMLMYMSADKFQNMTELESILNGVSE